MSDELLLSLASWPESDPFTTSLSSLIPRIQTERGPFKNVSEEGLKEEIAAEKLENLEKQDETEDEETKEEQAIVSASADHQQLNIRESLAIKRQELIKLVEQSHFEAMYALDFVSLLLSSVKPGPAETSMSRHLKEHVKSGSLGVESVRKKEVPATVKDDIAYTIKGWRSDAIERSAKSLLTAASRLGQESEREETYWHAVLQVKTNGWTLCRIPREPQSLGVRFGFTEGVNKPLPQLLNRFGLTVCAAAGADEKYRGLGVLRKGIDGVITMQDLGNSNTNRNAVRIRIVRDGEVTGASRPFADDNTSTSITGMIETSRNFAYQHELFLEIAREARSLANLGFRNTDDSVTFDLGVERSILIDMTNNADVSSSLSSNMDDETAEAISMALHILLSHAHRNALKRKRQPPQPISQRPQPNPPLLLLRPIASHLRHYEQVEVFKISVNKLISFANAADVHARLVLERCHNCISREINNVETAVDSLLGLLETKAIIKFPGSWKVAVLIQTMLGPPIFGTRYLVQTVHDGSCATLMANNTFASAPEIQRYLQWCLERSVVNEIQLAGLPWSQIALSNEMSQTSEKNLYKRLRVEVEGAVLAIRWTIAGGQDQNHIWNETGEKRALFSVLDGI